MKAENLDDCFKLRLLRKIKPDKIKSKKSIEIAEKELMNLKLFMDFARKHKQFSFIIRESYNVIFHSSRALLYYDGIQEKSHYAIYIYLKDKYAGKLSLPTIKLFDIYRLERHEAVYGLDFIPNEEEAENAIKDAEYFFNEVKRLL
jgi:uncharacterized protein (UPF0332 family)